MSSKTDRRRTTEPRWWFILYAFALGCLISVLAWAGGQTGLAWFATPWLTLFGVVMAFTPYGRLRERSKDERHNAIDREAAVFSYGAIIVTVLSAWLWTLAHGNPSGTLTLLGVVGGASYLGALAVLDRKR